MSRSIQAHAFAPLSLRPLPFLVAVLSLSAHVRSATTNRTIDDADYDVVSYLPAAAWNAGQNCSSCLLKPDPNPNKVWNGTWHDTTQLRADKEQHTVTVSFTGVHHTHVSYQVVADVLVMRHGQERRCTFTVSSPT
jgi:hypothetical protein